MWISKRIASASIKSQENLEGEVTYSTSNTVNVQNSVEHRDLLSIAPRGIAYVPKDGDKTVILPVGENFFCAGVIAEDKNLEPGELMLYSSGGANIILKNNGQVLINGSEIH